MKEDKLLGEETGKLWDKLELRNKGKITTEVEEGRR